MDKRNEGRHAKGLVEGTYSFFRFGPGFPLALGVAAVPSMAVALRLVPGFGPFRGFGLSDAAAGGASDDGVLVPFMMAVESAGVAAGVGSMVIWGVSDGGEVEAESCTGGATGSWGNEVKAVDASLSVTTSDFDFVVIFASSNSRRGVAMQW